MNKITAILSIGLAFAGTMQAEPETRRAIPVKQSAKLPAQPQVRRAVPIKQADIDAEMVRASAFATPAPTLARVAAATPTPAHATIAPAPTPEVSANNEASGGGGFLAFLVAAYFFPTIVAALCRNRNDGAIFVVNLFLGWTFVGWVVALAWAVVAQPKVRTA